MKILCITNDFGPRAGGIESFVIGLIERLPHSSVLVYTSSQADSEDYDKRWLADYGVQVIRDKSRILLPTPRVAKAVNALVRDLAIERAFFGAAAPLGLLAKGLRKNGVQKIVALTHGHEVWWAKIFPFNVALRYMSHSLDYVTYLGDFTKRAIINALGKNSEGKLRRIAPGIDVNHFAPQHGAAALRTKLGLDDKKVIISVGRLVHRKGQDRLIEALPEIVKCHPETQLLIVGTGPYEKHLKELARRLEIESSISFMGRINFLDLPLYFSLGDIFVMPSRSRFAGLEVEGLGIVYLEASACGLPVVAGKSGGAPDAVIEGVTGVTVDGNDISAIADSVISLLNQPLLAQNMGRNGRDWIIAEWQWDKWSREFNSLLKLDQPV